MAYSGDFPIPWDFPNLADGEVSNPDKRADGERVEDNLFAVAAGIFFLEIRGDWCDNNGSTPVLCKLIAKTEAGDTGLVEAGDFVIVMDSTSANTWEVIVTVNDQIDFGDNQMTKGTKGVLDYSQASLRTGLRMAVSKRKPVFTASRLNLDHALLDPLTFDKIKLSSGEVCQTRYEATKGIVDAIADGGGLKSSTVQSSNLMVDGFHDEGHANLVWGNLLRDSYGLGVPDNCTLWNAPGAGTGLDSTHAWKGDKSMKVVANAGGSGGFEIIPVYPWTVSDFQGLTLGATVKIWSDTVDGVKIGIDDGVSITWSDAGPDTANEFLTLDVTKDINAAATKVSVIVAAVVVGVTFWADGIMLCHGDTPYSYSPNEIQSMVYYQQDNNFENLACWSDFELKRNAGNTTSLGDCWFAGATGAMPNGWIASGVLANYPDYYNTDAYEQDGCMRLRLVLGEWIAHYLGYASTGNPCLEYTLGKPLTAAFWIKRLGGGSQPINLTIRIAYQVGTAVTNTDATFYIDDMANWTRCAVTIPELPSGASYARIYLMHNHGGAAGFDILVDAEMLTASNYAVDYQPSSIWNEEQYEFTFPGSLVATQYFYIDSIQGASRNMNEPSLVYGLHFREGTKCGGIGTDTARIRTDLYTTGVGWATGSGASASISGAGTFEEAWGIASPLGWLDTGDRISVDVAAISAPAGQNAIVTVYGLTFGK